MRYFLTGRPFRLLPTSGLYFLVVGEGLILATNTVRQCRMPWPTEFVTWLMWLLAAGALLLLALVFQAAVREYVRRADKPRRFWQMPNLLTIGSGEEKGPSQKNQ
jgi:hypothetical protein